MDDGRCIKMPHWPEPMGQRHFGAEKTLVRRTCQNRNRAQKWVVRQMRAMGPMRARHGPKAYISGHESQPFLRVWAEVTFLERRGPSAERKKSSMHTVKASLKKVGWGFSGSRPGRFDRPSKLGLVCVPLAHGDRSMPPALLQYPLGAERYLLPTRLRLPLAF